MLRNLQRRQCRVAIELSQVCWPSSARRNGFRTPGRPRPPCSSARGRRCWPVRAGGGHAAPCAGRVQEGFGAPRPARPYLPVGRRPKALIAPGPARQGAPGAPRRRQRPGYRRELPAAPSCRQPVARRQRTPAAPGPAAPGSWTRPRPRERHAARCCARRAGRAGGRCLVGPGRRCWPPPPSAAAPAASRPATDAAVASMARPRRWLPHWRCWPRLADPATPAHRKTGPCRRIGPRRESAQPARRQPLRQRASTVQRVAHHRASRRSIGVVPLAADHIESAPTLACRSPSPAPPACARRARWR